MLVKHLSKAIMKQAALLKGGGRTLAETPWRKTGKKQKHRGQEKSWLVFQEVKCEGGHQKRHLKKEVMKVWMLGRGDVSPPPFSLIHSPDVGRPLDD